MYFHRLLRPRLLVGRRSVMSATRPQVYVTRPDIPQEAITELKKRCDVESWQKSCPVPRDELLGRIKGKDALFCMVTDKIDDELLNKAGPSLKVIGTMSVGFEHIDLNACKKSTDGSQWTPTSNHRICSSHFVGGIPSNIPSHPGYAPQIFPDVYRSRSLGLKSLYRFERNVLVGNTPDVLTDATAELGVALLLATSRRLFEARKEIDNGGWSNVAWSPVWMCGTALKNSTVGIVGFGRIGQAVAERLKPFKVKCFLYSGHREKPEGHHLGAKFVPFETLLNNSDFVIVCCSLNPETANLFDHDAFSKMKNTAIFINISRGGVVNQDALLQALTTNQIKAAGLDVMTPEPLPSNHPFTKMTNCTLLPHIGSATVETRTGMAMLTSANILSALEGKDMPCPLTVPDEL